MLAMNDLDSDEKLRVIDIALGRIPPQNGLEKHFLQVLAGEAMACTPEEKAWVAFHDAWLEDCVEAELVELLPHRLQSELDFGEDDGFALQEERLPHLGRQGMKSGPRIAMRKRTPPRRKR